MSFETIASIVLSYFFIRYLAFSYQAWQEGRSRLWVGGTLMLAVSLCIPFAAVWL
jgi:hypothetical protein